MGPWCGEWPDNLMMDTSDNAAMDGVYILTPEQVGVSKNVESSDDSKSLVACKSCDKKGYYNGWKTVQAEDRKSDQATYGEVCCVFFYGLPV